MSEQARKIAELVWRATQLWTDLEERSIREPPTTEIHTACDRDIRDNEARIEALWSRLNTPALLRQHEDPTKIEVGGEVWIGKRENPTPMTIEVELSEDVRAGEWLAFDHGSRERIGSALPGMERVGVAESDLTKGERAFLVPQKGRVCRRPEWKCSESWAGPANNALTIETSREYTDIVDAPPSIETAARHAVMMIDRRIRDRIKAALQCVWVEGNTMSESALAAHHEQLIKDLIQIASTK